jgi:hypothetical protein
MIGISTLHFAIRLLLAIAMGAIVGLERQWRQRMAGTRTNALVAAGAAAFVMCGCRLKMIRRLEAVSSLTSSREWAFSEQGHLQGWCERTWAQYGCRDLAFRSDRRTYWARFFSSGPCARVRGPLHQPGPSTTGLSPSPRPPRSNSCRNALRADHVAFHPGGTKRRERANPHPRRDNDRRPEQRSYRTGGDAPLYRR